MNRSVSSDSSLWFCDSRTRRGLRTATQRQQSRGSAHTRAGLHTQPQVLAQKLNMLSSSGPRGVKITLTTTTQIPR